MTQVLPDTQLHSSMQRLNELLDQVQKIPDPALRETTGEIVQAMMEFHGAALTRIVEKLADTGQSALIQDLAGDELVSSMLLLYGLHPLDLEARVHAALESVRPYLASHGGNVELLGITPDGAVRLAMQGSCHGCPSSAATLKNSIEQAIYDKAPDVAEIRVEEADKPANHDHHGSSNGNGNGFVSVEQLIAGSGRHSSRGTNHDAP